MPRATTNATLARQWELLRLVPGRPPGKTVRQLVDGLEAAGYPVTKRTVERDLADLAEIFPLCCYGHGTVARHNRSGNCLS
jgi:hypothetical protein